MSKQLNHCWNCGGLIPFSTGKRKRHYCNDTCRIAYKRKTEQTKSEHPKPNTQSESVTNGYYVGGDDGAVKAPINNIGKPANFGLPDCECKHCQSNRANNANRATENKLIINHGAYKTSEQLAKNEVNRVSLPGDVDYEGVIR